MKNTYWLTATIALSLLFNSCATLKTKQHTTSKTNQVKLSSEIVWEQLNPTRGEKSPKAGTIWGDRKVFVPTGFLAKFVNGFSSPPHIHNVTYRAVVLKGLIHNATPKAENQWMKKGSFWTQPQGQAHITSAKGTENIAYVEIDKGPYLVKSIRQSFKTKEEPINIEASNLIWLNSQKSTWVHSKKAELSYLWNDGKNQGLFIKLKPGFKGAILNDGTTFHTVLIDGNLRYEGNEENLVLDAGSYFTSSEKSKHLISNTTNSDVILYIRTNDTIKII